MLTRDGPAEPVSRDEIPTRERGQRNVSFIFSCSNEFGAQIRLHQRYKTANGFRTRRNYYYIWPIILLELKYIITSARIAAAIAKAMVELRSIVFDSSEERARCRQGPRCLRCLKLRMVGGLGGLMMTPRRSSGCGACIPELTTRRHRGPVLFLGSRAKASTLEGRQHRRFTVGSAFHMSFAGSSPCWRHSRSGIIICNKLYIVGST